ncbi:MAG: GNAT family N-acetyltransferase [Roseburia sp.]|nr:GNAT family N-acetyltransferase [Roseburia sp.]
MEIKVYTTLPQEAVSIRKTVFCEEQGFEEEFDSVDAEAVHLLMLEQGEPVGTCRFFWDADRNAYMIGRIAVLKPYRGQARGSALLQAAERQIQERGGTQAHLHAQTQAAAFYSKNGYEAYGEIEYEQGCPHVWMRKRLNAQAEEGQEKR